MAVVRGQVRFHGHSDLTLRARERPYWSGWSEVEQTVPRQVRWMLRVAVDRQVLRRCYDIPVVRTQHNVEHIFLACRPPAHHKVEALLNRIYVPVDDDHIQRDIRVSVLKLR